MLHTGLRRFVACDSYNFIPDEGEQPKFLVS